MSRGIRGTQQTGLPKLHARGEDGKPLCNPRPRKWGHLMAQVPGETDCVRCRRALEVVVCKAPDCGRKAVRWYGWKQPYTDELVKAPFCAEHARQLKTKTYVTKLGKVTA